MYEIMKKLLPAIDSIGNVSAVHVDESWVPGLSRISVEGKTLSGKPFVFNLEVGTHERSES